ncbi:Cleavage polyadenylation factor subunit clp1 [Taxawa tesnikishii (nom. ined.)]|nr:Cleavage polyadenylation factor subunit clp1 [Dothideales sp. JES 119]
MSIPGLSIPGLDLPSLAAASSATSVAAAVRPPRTEELPAQTELRFEVAFGTTYTVKLARGTADFLGTELTPNVPQTFSGTKGAIFTWNGCALEISGEAESEYVGSETDYMKKWITAHQMLETMRDDFSTNPNSEPPRVLIVGSDNVGKTSLARCFAAWSLRMSRTPTIGLLTIPGSLTAVTLSSILDVEDGWGSAPISGPTAIPVKTPLVYHYPFASPETNTAFNEQTGRGPHAKASGIIIDTPGSINNARNGYENIAHIISEFSINTVFVLGSERLSSDLRRRFAASKHAISEDEVVVLRVPESKGAVTRDEDFMRGLRQSQVRNYFFGSQGRENAAPLNPHGQWWDFGDLTIYRAVDPSAAPTSLSFLPGMDEDEGATGQQGREGGFECTTPNQGMVDAILAVKLCAGNAGIDAVRDSCVMGFVYVAEVDETRKKVRFLAPHPSRWGDKPLVWGNWPEGVGDLVA